MSLGSDFYSETEQATLNEVRSRGIFVVASAGNGNSDVPRYPAAYDGVLSVSATTITGTRAPYSSFGPSIDLAAPGGDARFDLDDNGQPDGVVSTLGEQSDDAIDFGYAILQGTSMAAPHVSGVIALMKAIYPELTPGQFDALLQAGALTDDAGAPGRDDAFGWGIINARKAVEAALSGSGGVVSPALSVSSGTLNFQSFTRDLEFSIGLLGEGPAVVTVTVDVPWLTVSQITPSTDGLGQYQATVDRAGLPADRYTATIHITTDNPAIADRTINVLMTVAAADVDADAGQHYVVLVSRDGNESLAAQIVNAVDGEYTFALRDVPPGEYRLFAGTDLDNDGFICDGGEACGAFPSLSSPAIISVDARQQAQLEGLSFLSEFRTTATTTSGARASTDTDTSSATSGLQVDKPAPARYDRPMMESDHEFP
jgi:serine protease